MQSIVASHLSHSSHSCQAQLGCCSPCHPPAPLVQVQYSAPKLKVSALPNSTSCPPLPPPSSSPFSGSPTFLPALCSPNLVAAFTSFRQQLRLLDLSSFRFHGRSGGLELCETTPSAHWYPFSVGLSAQASIIAETNFFCLNRRFNSISTHTISCCEYDIISVGSEPRDVRREEDSGVKAKEHT
jgi:hypothetical protein